jgi:hypothetical protein
MDRMEEACVKIVLGIECLHLPLVATMSDSATVQKAIQLA